MQHLTSNPEAGFMLFLLVTPHSQVQASTRSYEKSIESSFLDLLEAMLIIVYLAKHHVSLVTRGVK